MRRRKEGWKMNNKNLKWKKYIIRVKAEDNTIEGIYSSSSDFPPVSPQTIANRARCKNKEPDEEGFVYYRWEDYEELFPDLFHSYLQKIYSSKYISFSPNPPLNLVLTIGGKIISINDLYKARLIYVGGKPKPTIYKNPKAKEVASEIYRQLQSVDLTEWIPWLEKNKAYKISINFVVKSGITRRDTENLGKNIIDTVVRYIRSYSGITHFDDSEFLEVYFTKSIIPGAKHEYAMISLTESFHNIRFDYIPEPTKFYLGGNLGVKWKEEVIDELEQRNKKWYTPELNLWNSAEWSIEEARNCNTYLEIFDLREWREKSTKLRELIAKIRKFETLKEQDKFLYIGFLGELPEDTWIQEDIKELLSMSYPNLKVKLIQSPKEILLDK